MTAALTSPVPIVAPFRLDRFGGASPDILDLSQTVREALHAHARMLADADRAADALVQRIFELVPRCDRDARRALLRLKRQVHNQRPVTHHDHEVLTAAGGPQHELAPWVDARDGIERSRRALDDAVVACQRDTADVLRKQITEGSLALALPLIAPDFATRAEKADYGPGTKAGRTALLYLMRAALKPSPLSHLTTIALHPAGDEQNPTGRPAPSAIAIPVGFAHRIFAELAATPRFMDAFGYAPAHRVDTADDRIRLAVAAISSSDGFQWSNERIADVTGYAGEVASIGPRASGPFSDEREPLRLSRHVRMGLLVPRAPWAPGSATPLSDLARALKRSRAHDAPGIAQSLEDLEATAGAVAGADPATRRALARALRGRGDEVADRCPVPRWSGTLVHEDVAEPRPVGPLPESVADDISSVAAALRPHVFRSHVYDIVLDAFRSVHGVGGRCDDAAGFFMRLYSDPQTRKRLWQARWDDLTTDGPASGRSTLPVGRTSAPPAAAIFYQLASDSAESLRQGDYSLVVNQHGSALGGLVSRFGRVLGRATVAGQLMPWLRTVFPGCSVRSMTHSAQVNNLQHAGAGYLPEIVWPVERQERTVPSESMDSLALVHDPHNDTLNFRDAAGAAIAPVYTGIVPASVCTGPVQLALQIMDPWVDGSPLTRAGHPLLRARALGNGVPDIVATPRVVDQRVVVRRARWLVPCQLFPTPRASESTMDYLIRLDRWRRGWNIPEEVFFVAVGGGDPLDEDRRKPIWLDFALPHSVYAALPLLKGATTLCIEETMPSRRQAWHTGPTGPRTVEHISFVAWSRPAGSDG